MKKISLFFLLSVTLLNYACKKKCIGEPIVIVAAEELKVQILNTENESIFNSDYLLNDLKIYENENLIKHKVEDTVFPLTTIVSIPTAITTYGMINNNLGTELTTTLYFKYNTFETDTLEVKLFPKVDDKECNQFYDRIELVYNSEVLKIDNRKNCISCKNPIVLIKI